MSDSKVANASGADLAVVDGVLDGLPAFEALRLAAQRAVNEVEVDVVQSALFERAPDRLARRVVRHILLELGREGDILALQAVSVGVARQEIFDGVADFALVFVPLCRVDAVS